MNLNIKPIETIADRVKMNGRTSHRTANVAPVAQTVQVVQTPQVAQTPQTPQIPQTPQSPPLPDFDWGTNETNRTDTLEDPLSPWSRLNYYVAMYHEISGRRPLPEISPVTPLTPSFFK